MTAAPSGESGRTGVILSAGFGSRLAGVDDDTVLKPLTPVAGTPLMLRTLRSLERAGCGTIAIVLGHGREDIEESTKRLYEGPATLEFAYNADFHLGNGLSVLAAREHIDGPFVMTMADHILCDEMMVLARDYAPVPGGAALLVDYKVETIFDMDDATKVLEREGRIASIGKALTEFNCIDTGVFVCTTALLEAIDEVYQATGDASLSDGVQALASKGLMHTVDIGDGFWQDIDTPEMLAHAETVLRGG